MIEIRRSEAFSDDHAEYGEELACLGCGKTIYLHWNGGELDRRECCSYVYELEHVKTDLVISKRDEPVTED